MGRNTLPKKVKKNHGLCEKDAEGLMHPKTKIFEKFGTFRAV